LLLDTRGGWNNCAARSPRPALADERGQFNAAGQAELKLNTPWRDGTTHLTMSPAGVHAKSDSAANAVPAAPAKDCLTAASLRSRTTDLGRLPQFTTVNLREI